MESIIVIGELRDLLCSYLLYDDIQNLCVAMGIRLSTASKNLYLGYPFIDDGIHIIETDTRTGITSQVNTIFDYDELCKQVIALAMLPHGPRHHRHEVVFEAVHASNKRLKSIAIISYRRHSMNVSHFNARIIESIINDKLPYKQTCSTSYPIQYNNISLHNDGISDFIQNSILDIFKIWLTSRHTHASQYSTVWKSITKWE